MIGASPGSATRNSLVLLAFDIYGTVIDPGGIAAELRRSFAERAPLAAQLWRSKQLEFTFRRALMRRYADFDTCTAQALDWLGAQLGVPLDETVKHDLLRAYRALPPFPEVEAALASLRDSGHRPIALTNGTHHSVGALLERAGIAHYFDTVLSADAIRTFKPDPAVYELARQEARAHDGEVWLVSGNPFDVIGAKAAGLAAAWVRRDAAVVFDPWEYQPDVVVQDLGALCDALPRG